MIAGRKNVPRVVVRYLGYMDGQRQPAPATRSDSPLLEPSARPTPADSDGGRGNLRGVPEALETPRVRCPAPFEPCLVCWYIPQRRSRSRPERPVPHMCKDICTHSSSEDAVHGSPSASVNLHRTVLVFVSGCNTSGDAFHQTPPLPTYMLPRERGSSSENDKFQHGFPRVPHGEIFLQHGIPAST